MRRKIIKQGAATLTLSLPASWTKKLELKSGDELDVEEIDSNLVVSAKKIEFKAKTEVDVSGLSDSLIWSYLNALYMKGVDEIKITFDRPETINLIQKIVDSLVGYTIIEQSTKICLIKDITGARKEEFDGLFKRIFFMLNSIAKDSLDAIKNKDTEALKSIKQRDYDINKLTLLCVRILSKWGYKEVKKTSAIHDIMILLENIGDVYADIAKEFISTKKISKEMIREYEKINSTLEMLYPVFFRFDREKLKELHDKNRAARKEILKGDSKSKEDIIFVYHLKKISDLIGYVLELLLVVSL